MNLHLSRSALVRIAPFVAFMLLLAVRGALAESDAFDPRWLYGAGVLLTGGMLLWFRHDYGELTRQNWPTAGEAALAVAVGAVVCWLWVLLDAPWMQIGPATAGFTPLDAQGQPIWP